MGTRLIAGGLDPARDDPALWIIDHPQAIHAIHALDREAGAEALTTCTFGASRPVLESFGRSGDLERINQTAVALARRVIGPWGYVLGNLGPRVAERPGAALEQAVVLAAAGVDALVLETFTEGPILGVLDQLARAPLPPLIASLWRWPEPAAPFARRMLDKGAAAVGINCQPGPAAALAFARSIAAEGEIPLYLRPSARPGDPDSSPDAFARAVPAWVALGGRLLGGCCGSTERHVAAVSQALNHSMTRFDHQAAPTP